MNERKTCGCGPRDMCTICTDLDVFAEAFMAALSAQIREDGGDGPV